jgi:hypothetical protein
MDESPNPRRIGPTDRGAPSIPEVANTITARSRTRVYFGVNSRSLWSKAETGRERTLVAGQGPYASAASNQAIRQGQRAGGWRRPLALRAFGACEVNSDRESSSRTEPPPATLYNNSVNGWLTAAMVVCASD